MYQHLTLALDGSHNAHPALIEACRIAAHGNARLSLLHVVSLHDFSVESVGFIDNTSLYNEARKYGQKLLDDACAYAREQGVSKVDAKLLDAPEGGHSMSKVLVEETRQSGADLLVIGTHGHRGWRHLLLGSFAEEVMRQSCVPLLVVRNPEDNDSPDGKLVG